MNAYVCPRCILDAHIGHEYTNPSTHIILISLILVVAHKNMLPAAIAITRSAYTALINAVQRIRRKPTCEGEMRCGGRLVSYAIEEVAMYVCVSTFLHANRDGCAQKKAYRRPGSRAYIRSV